MKRRQVLSMNLSCVSAERADVLVAMADFAMTSLAADGKSACTADKYAVIVHVEANRAEYVSAETRRIVAFVRADDGPFVSARAGDAMFQR